MLPEQCLGWRDTSYHWQTCIDSSSPEQNSRHFADNIFKRTFLNEKVRYLTEVSLKFDPKGPIANDPALV